MKLPVPFASRERDVFQVLVEPPLLDAGKQVGNVVVPLLLFSRFVFGVHLVVFRFFFGVLDLFLLGFLQDQLPP